MGYTFNLNPYNEKEAYIINVIDELLAIDTENDIVEISFVDATGPKARGEVVQSMYLTVLTNSEPTSDSQLQNKAFDLEDAAEAKGILLGIYIEKYEPPKYKRVVWTKG